MNIGPVDFELKWGENCAATKSQFDDRHLFILASIILLCLIQLRRLEVGLLDTMMINNWGVFHQHSLGATLRRRAF